MKPRYKSRVSLKTKSSVNKYIVAGVTFSLVIGFACYLVLNFGNYEEAKAAVTRQSKTEFAGLWEAGNSWANGAVPGTSDNYVINGSITKSSSLNLGNSQSLVVNSGDTLLIDGNLYLSNQSSLSIESNAVLVVRGDYESHQQTSDLVKGSGTLIIVGYASFFGGAADIDVNSGGIVYYDPTKNPNLPNYISGGGSTGDIYTLQGILFDMTGIKTMPVSLEKFWAKVNYKKVEVNWISSNEKNVTAYQVQRSRTGSEFKTVGEVKPGKEGKTYYYIDQNAMAGHYYYRIAVVEGENIVQYSPITEVDFNSDNSHPVTLFPSVTKGDEINFKGEEVQNKPVTIIVYDINGKTIHQDHMETNGSESYKINFENRLNKGNYFIHFVYDNKVDKQKFVVSH